MTFRQTLVACVIAWTICETAAVVVSIYMHSVMVFSSLAPLVAGLSIAPAVWQFWRNNRKRT